MKKLICMLLALVLTFGLCACSGSEDKDNDDKKDEVAEEIAKDNKDEAEDEDGVTVEDTDDTYTENPSDDNYGDEDIGNNTGDAGFSIGKITGNTYRNDFADVTVTLPTGWTFYDEAQILELNNIASDYIDDEVVEMLESANIVFDMYAVNQSTGDSVNINYEKVGAEKFEKYTVAQLVASQIDAVKSTYAQMGFTNVEVTQSTKMIDGRNMEILNLSGEIQGIKMYMIVLNFRQGDYMAAVTIGSVGSDRVDEFLGYFEF